MVFWDRETSLSAAIQMVLMSRKSYSDHTNHMMLNGQYKTLDHQHQGTKIQQTEGFSRHQEASHSVNINIRSTIPCHIRKEHNSV